MHAITWIAEGRPVTTVALDLGYESPSAFCAMFKRELGVSRAHGGTQENRRIKHLDVDPELVHVGDAGFAAVALGDDGVLYIRDMVRGQIALLDALGIARLHAVVGGSMGGMQVLQWGIEYPLFTKRLLAMATTARESAQAIAFNEVGRQAIMQDPAWNAGDYPDRKSVV